MRLIAIQLATLLMVFTIPAQANDIEKLGKKIEHHCGKPCKVIKKVGHEVIVTPLHEIEEFFQKADCKLFNCEVLEAGRKVVRETAKAPGAVAKHFKENWDELQEESEKQMGKCQAGEVRSVLVRNLLPSVINVKINMISSRVNGDSIGELHSCLPQANIVISIKANPVNCGLPSSSTIDCWKPIHEAKHSAPVQFSVQLTKYNEITVYFPEETLIARK